MTKWHENTSNNIIGIPLSDDAPKWQCSSPTPEWQLTDLGRRADYLVNEFKDYEKDPELEKLISGKRLAFIGPAPSLNGQGLGEMIDSYDLVVRINTAYHMPEELWKDYGKRTDILISCLNFNKIRALQENMDFTESVKYLIQPQLSMWDIRKIEKITHEWNVPFHNVCDGYLFKINKEIGTTTNTGLLGVVTLLNYNIKELYVGGFTFFDMGSTNGTGEYYNKAHLAQTIKYDPVQVVDNKLTSASLRLDDLHIQKPQIYYFGKIMEKYYGNILQTDEYLTHNFKLWISGNLKNRQQSEIKKILEIDKYLKDNYNLAITIWKGK
jgi:hypothetical protein|tara:strand:- start:91 stop:1065 length:975 start_codon:yes stop_codon:yes gene_type:complete